MNDFIPADAPQPQVPPSGEAGCGGRQAQMLPPVVIHGLRMQVFAAQTWAAATTACAAVATMMVLTHQPWMMTALSVCAAIISGSQTGIYGQRLITRYQSMFDRMQATRDDMSALMAAYLRASTKVAPPKFARNGNVVPIKGESDVH